MNLGLLGGKWQSFKDTHYAAIGPGVRRRHDVVIIFNV